MSADFDHFEPLEMVQGFVAFGERILDRSFDAIWLGPNNFDFYKYGCLTYPFLSSL